MNKFVSNLNLLFVHEVNFETKVIFEMQEIPEFLAARGNTITYIDFPEGRRFWRRGNASRSRLVQGRTQPQVAIQLERPFTIGLPGLDRLLAPFAILPVLKKLFKNQKFDAIVLYAVPTYGPQVIYLAKRFGIPTKFEKPHSSLQLK
jgi:hypothetical protein